MANKFEFEFHLASQDRGEMR